MRLLVLTSEFLPLHGGIGTYAREIARAASEIGFDVMVAAPDYRKELGAGDLSQDDRANFSFKVIRFAGGRHSFRDIPAKALFLRSLLKEKQFDIVHAADWPFFIPLTLLRGLHKGRTLLTFHGTEVAEINVAQKRLIISATGMFGGWAEIVTNSRFTRSLFLQHFPKTDPNLAFAERLGVSDFWFGSVPNPESTRDQFGIAPDRKILMTVSRMTPRKGHLPAIAAMRTLPDALRSKITYLAVGPNYDDGYTEAVRSAGQEAGIDLRLTGPLPNEDIRSLYSIADAFVLPGIYLANGDFEGFGLVYLEAAAQGLPSIAANNGGVPDAICHGETGLLIDDGDRSALASALTTLLTDDERRRTMGAKALEWARTLSWRRCAAATYLNTRPHNAIPSVHAAAGPKPAD